MSKSLTSREVIIYLNSVKHGVWKDIYKAVSDKEALPDADDCRKVINEFLRENEGAVTIVDESYPRAMRARKLPPFVIVPKGDLGLLNKDQIVCLETGALSPALTKHGIRHAFLDDDGNSMTICVPHLDTATGEYVNDSLTIKENREGYLNTMIMIGKKFVAIDGADDFVDAINESGTAERFALPGNSGCACNQLIKSGWKLCDTWQDLVFDTEPDDPKED